MRQLFRQITTAGFQYHIDIYFHIFTLQTTPKFSAE